jgi:hypothetical protein
MDDFERSLPLINDLYSAVEHWPRKTVTIAEVALALGMTFNEIIRIFDLLGLRPATWESPSDYAVESIRESCCRHEVSWRH